MSADTLAADVCGRGPKPRSVFCLLAHSVRCPDTGSNYLMGGPLWAEPIHDQAFVKGLLTEMEGDKAR